MSENLNKKPPKGILKQSSSFDTNTKVCNSFATPRSSITSLGPGPGPDFGANILCEEEDPTSPTNRKSSKCAKFDEMNILETLHPADKDYGHMKIEEPKTPFNYYEDGEEDLQSAEDSASQKKRHSSHQSKKPHEILLDPEELAKKIKEKGVDLPSFMNNVEDEKSDEEEDMDPDCKAKQVVFESKRKAHYNEYFAVKLARQLMEKETDEDDEEEEGKDKKFIPSEEINPEESEAEAESSEMKDVTDL